MGNRNDVPELSESVEIAAPPATVWGLVRDPRNMTRWSPQTSRSFLRTPGEIREGSRFLNINRKGVLVWPTRSKVVRFVPEQEIAWRVKDNYAIWSLRLEPADVGGTTGTRLVQTRETPQGISNVSARLTDTVMGGQDRFTRDLRAGMAQTLERIRAEAEG